MRSEFERGKTKRILMGVLSALLLLFGISPLLGFNEADEFLVAVNTPSREVFLGSPSILRLANGKYLLSLDEFADNPDDWPRKAKIYSSENLKQWKLEHTLDSFWGTLFLDDNQSVYHLGVNTVMNTITLTQCDSGAVRCDKKFEIKHGNYESAPLAFVKKDGKLYFAFTDKELAPHFSKMQLFIADISKDLMSADAWSWTNQVDIPGAPLNLRWGLHKGRDVPPIGALEGNVVLVKDSIKIFARMRTQGIPNYAAAYDFDVTDGKLRFESFIPWPGGQAKFNVVHDFKTGIYWLASVLVADHLQDKVSLNIRGFRGAPDNERRFLYLWYSIDSQNWFPAKKIASSRKLLDSFSYPQMLIDGKDLLVVARSSIEGVNQHDTNKITLHRIKDFRDLVDQKLKAE
jgi:hypothetical protein